MMSKEMCFQVILVVNYEQLTWNLLVGIYQFH